MWVRISSGPGGRGAPGQTPCGLPNVQTPRARILRARGALGAFDAQCLMWPDVAMKRVKIADLKDHLSQHLRAVERGEEIEVTDRHRPIVRLVPIRTAVPQIRIIQAKRPFAEVRNTRYPKARWRSGSLRLLLEERGKR